MDLSRIVTELRNERDRIDRAISSLQGGSLGRRGRPVGSATATKRRGGITAAGRKRLSDAMKRRWAERRAKTGRAKTAPVSKKRRGGLTAAGRKRLSQLMKKRWAERRKKTS